MSEKDRILDFSEELNDLGQSVSETENRMDEVQYSVSETSDLIQSIIGEFRQIPGALVVVEGGAGNADERFAIDKLNTAINGIEGVKLPGDIRLSTLDIIVSIIAGTLAAVIDIAFVGAPEVVKIYKGGENFDGSILTAALRKVGNDNDSLSKMLEWCCEKCKVPYDISVQKDIVNPNNHRLRSFGHDPFIGMLFAMVDIIFGTATLVDNQGRLRIVVNSRNYPVSQKYLSLIYYFGHLLSDVCTARGLPIPGFILTQFFTNGSEDNSIARVAEQMYRDGYDLRHLASMTTPVMIKNMITDIYLRLFTADKPVLIETQAERQIRENRQSVYKYKLRLVSDAVGCGGNVLKFFVPPTMGNITALNIAEWASLLQDTIIDLKYQLRDKDIEKVIAHREILSDNWRRLNQSLV